ncbi:hypothetical protein M9458_015209, partial [Cirrhinus mrigala]
MAPMVAAERHLWLTLSDMKEKDRIFLLDAPLAPSGLFWPAVNSVVDRYQEAGKQAVAFQCSWGCWAGAAPAEYQLLIQDDSKAERCLSPVALKVGGFEKSSTKRTAEGSPYWGRAGCTAFHGVRVLLTLPVFQGELTPQSLLPGNVAELGSLPPLRGEPLQDTGLKVQTNPEADLERLVPLVDYLAAWKLLPNVSAWVLHTVERGYHIQFGAPPPPFSRVFPTLVGPKQGLVMEQEVDTLLRKEAIEVVPPHDRESGFYSQYFIVPKKDGGLRPILDLRQLNHSVMQLKFKMLTVSQMVSQTRSEDWFVTIDLKGAYFHEVPAFRGEAYQYRVLPFGLALSPRTFTKCVDAALAPLRLQGICILNYIDDCRWRFNIEMLFSLTFAKCVDAALAPLRLQEQMVVQHRDVVLAHMKELGLRLNAKKSVLSPLQTTMQARLSPARIELILTASLTVKQFQQLLGLMAAASNVIPFGLLYMRPLQWWLRTNGLSAGGNPFRMNHQGGLRSRPLYKLVHQILVKLYALKWRLFTSWCGHHQQDPVNCPVGTVLVFLQDRFSAGLAHSTLKVYVAA